MKIRCIHTKIAMLTILMVAVLTLVACARSGTGWLWNGGDSQTVNTGDMIIRVTGESEEASATRPTTDAMTELPTEAEAGDATATESGVATEAETGDTVDTSAEPETEPETEPDTETDAAIDTPTEEESTIATEPMTDPETETETETATETDAIWTNAVSYTGEAHPGTDIRYVGTGENRNKVIVIDAGHQAKGNSETEPLGPGSDEMKPKVSSGTSGDFSGTEEYELNLRVALALRDELIKRGYSVVMIRETHDVDISNAERAQIANDCQADACIRLHANGGDAAEKGAMAVCQTKDNPFSACRAVYAESMKLSECLLDAYCASSGIGRYETLPIWETDTMSGINWSAVPMTILEMGFMSNQEDDLRMAEEGFAEDAAIGIANGLDTYFASIS